MTVKTYETEFGGKPLKVEISDLADQANGSVLVRYGETAVFATAVMSKYICEGLDHFPLTVDYEERFYAAGMILGSRFIRREARPSVEAILTSRLIDRTIRPLFNAKMKNEVQVTVLALSIDSKNDPDIPAIFAASLALGISDIPWNGPIDPVRISYLEAGLPSGSPASFIINPTYEEREKTRLNIVVCGKDGRINMLEAKAKEAKEDILKKALENALPELAKIQQFQEQIIKDVGKKKEKIETKEEPAGMSDFFNKHFLKNLDKALYSGNKGDLGEFKSEWMATAKKEFGDENFFLADNLFEEKVNEIIHREILENEKRPDARKLDEIRPLYANVKIFPVLHGSAVFFRGGTHILSVVTLGGPKDVLWIQGMEIQTTKHFMHHYNFPPFSTGETGRLGGPGRREIGHGILAERALSAVIPSPEEFPYTIRVVSESMASNGSTSMGSVCASSLALMDAGIPIKNPVAGIAIGLMMDSQKYKILTDIQGPEDHHGDMDFKCAGTKEGVTAIQMDVKVAGVTLEILEKALIQAKKARKEILEVMLKIIPEPRKQLSLYAPRIIKMQINPDKIGLVIGPGGKMINSITEKTGAEIDIEQDGTIFISGKNQEDAEKARKFIEGLTHEYQIGEMARGAVVKILDFGAIVDISPVQDGMIHISELAPFRVEKVEDIVKIGDVVTVKIINIDERGKISLSLKQANPNYKPDNNARRRR
jgi:polyribonucleotide nucleotidyltransferase